MLSGLFSKITRQKTLSERIIKHQSVYIVVLFPITVAFLLTFVIARIISHVDPTFYIRIVEDLHIHHFAYGIFVLAASGYLALVASRAREKYLVALLHGFGLGLAFDEFGIWLRLTDETAARFSYDGALILGALFFLLVSAETGIKALREHFIKKPLTNSSSSLENSQTASPISAKPIIETPENTAL